MKSIALIVCLFLTGTEVQASDYITLTLASNHTKESGLNEDNHGLGINSNRYIAGFYKNSHNRTSIYAGYEPVLKTWGVVSLAAQVGAISGYEGSEIDAPSVKGIHLYILPELIFDTGDVRVKVGVIPSKLPVITYQLEFKF